MPRKHKGKDGPPKQPLTLAELAGHDDVCSDVMIDNAFYRFKIRKYRPKHIPVRGIKEEQIPQILLEHVIVGKNPEAAEKVLLNLSGLKRYQSTLRTKSQREHFIAHLRKYILMYQTDCPWEVSSTNRYTITTYEAAVTARRRIRQGEVIKYLTGTLVPLTTEESMDLDITNRNFSIVVNNRKKSDQMFLGPARFANHDCNSNARLQMEGVDSMRVVATRNIDIGEEITVSYGESYFGPDNVECLCATCEANSRNGWTSRAAFTQPGSGSSTPIPDIARAAESNKKRKREDSSTLRSLKKLKAGPSPSKLQYSWTPPSTSNSEIAQEDADGARDAITVVSRAGTDELSTPQRDNKGRYLPSPKNVRTEPTRNRVSRRSSSIRRKSFPLSPSTTSPSSHESENGLNAELGDTITVKIEQIEKVTVETDELTDLMNTKADNIAIQPAEEDTTNALGADQEMIDIFKDAHSELPTAPAKSVTRLSMTKVSTVASIEPTLQVTPAVVPSIEAAAPISTTKTTAALSVQTISPLIRVPGDYVLTRRLLAQPHDKWVRCQNDHCHGFFLQSNGYLTRRECPRCERHSMLYGFPWPKTDPDIRILLARQQKSKKKTDEGGSGTFSAYRRQGKSGKGSWVEGGGDDEERVMDHRTIHRFVGPEEEKEMTRKGLLIAAEEAKRMGEEDWVGLKGLDGQGRRSGTETSDHGGGRGQSFRESTEDGSASPMGYHNGGIGMLGELMREEGVDGEGRRRSGRIVESRVYVNVDMKR
ncbi:Histone-lysine N-methyltransferase set9 [Cyphellophora attinorum]|uniref:Histone-lysine N-methyltransferase SET9 n=1 Tax=Cyphellophora attinorum TaxID=1664694 RepID=A0A0N1HYL7_9EURO|nr:Histone-lysine N-methyltransferase set9 [Phialophora attinorum]KPI45956.1 Histone-lysine N-methyltransferase set9 [Phialophora attinorum]